MKMMICGDAHFGIRNNSTKHLDFQTTWFREELIPSIKKKKCESVVFLGDIFDSRINLSPLILQQVRQLFKELTSFVDVYCILGNHDIFYRNGRDVHSLDVLTDQGVNVIEHPTVMEIADKNMLFLPWVVKNESEEVSKLLVKDNYDACFGHIEINGFEKVKGVMEDEGFSTSLFENCNNVFSGHFHLKRDLKHINYVGTPFELTWNDYKDEKGLHVYDTKTGDIEFIETQNTPKHLKILVSSTSLEDIDRDLIANNIIRLVIDTELTEVQKIDYVEKINSLEPLLFTVDDESIVDFETDEEVEADIKDTLGFLSDFLDITELPEGLERKKLWSTVEEIYGKCARI
jgi:DNA repair exonuclease SbcCD nuclease subunit